MKTMLKTIALLLALPVLLVPQAPKAYAVPFPPNPVSPTGGIRLEGFSVELQWN